MGVQALIRSLVFSFIFLFLSTQPWDIVSKKPVLPIKMYVPFTIFLFDKISGKGKKAKYQQILQIFIDIPELRFLAVPPKLKGPPNQNVYIVLGFSMLFALIFVSLPQSIFQFIGFIIAISGTFGYWMSLHHYKFQSYTQMPFVSYIYVAVSIIGIVTIISDPIAMIKFYFKKNSKKQKSE